MNSRPSRKETLAFIGAFVLALGLRLLLLGKSPLNDSEATLALQALHIAQGAKPALDSNVAYVNITAVLFFIFGSANFLARIVPALAGSALALTPALFRDRLKAHPAVLLAFFLAIDPALVALSRQAGSSILSVTFAVLAVGYFLRQRSAPTGIFLALTLLCGPAIWPGALAILLTWMLSHFLAAPTPETSTSDPSETQTPSNPSTRLHDLRSFLTALLATLFIVGSIVLLAPQGLGAWLGSLPTYFAGWVTPSTVPAGRLFLALGVYELIAIPFALIAIVRGWWNGGQSIIRLSLWLVVALMIASFYPARQTTDLVWALIPLYTLASLELARHMRVLPADRMETGGVFIFTVLLLAFAWLDFNAMYSTVIPSAQGNIRLYLLAGSLLLWVVSMLLVGYGWSATIARTGAAGGALIVLGLYTLGAAWGATGLRNPLAAELWDTSPRAAQADLIAQTADDISKWSNGDPHSLPVLIQGVDSPALVWTLRFHDPQVVTSIDPASAPALVVTPPQQDLQLAASYRGQDFTWRQTPVWDTLPSYGIRWLTYHELPFTSETVIFWVRNDLFVDTKESQ